MKLLQETGHLYEIAVDTSLADEHPRHPTVVHSGDVVSVKRHQEQLSLALRGLARAYQSNQLLAATVWGQDKTRRTQEAARLNTRDNEAAFGLGQPAAAHLSDAWEAFGRAYGWDSPNAWREFFVCYGGDGDAAERRNLFQAQLFRQSSAV